MSKQPSTLEEYFGFRTQQSSSTSLTEHSNLEKKADEDKVVVFVDTRSNVETTTNT